MIRTFYIVSVAFVALYLSANIYASEQLKSPYYIKLEGGVSLPANKLNNQEDYYNRKLLKSGFYGGGAGYIFNDNIRTDIIVTKRDNYKFSYLGEINDSSVSANQKFNNITAMLNFYFGATVNKFFTPYISGGLGISKISASNYFSKSVQNGLADNTVNMQSSRNKDVAWNVGLGNQIKLTDNLYWDVFCRYIDLGKTKAQTVNSFVDGDMSSLQISPLRLKSYEFGISLSYKL